MGGVVPSFFGAGGGINKVVLGCGGSGGGGGRDSITTKIEFSIRI